MSTQFTNRQWRLPNNENKDKQSNYSMDFDSSSSDYIDIGTISSLNAQQNFSISLWFNENIPKTYGFIFSSGTGTNNDISINAGNGTLKINVGGTRNVNITSYSSNVWYHVVLTVENTTAKVYLNNSSPTTVTVGSNTSSSSGNNAKIGDLFVSGYHFNGQIDGVAIFNYALSSSQVTTLYGSSSTGIGNPMSLSPKPVAYYPLGDQDAFNGANYLVPNSSLKDYVFSFDGSNDYIDLNNAGSGIMDNQTSFSVSAWFKLNNNSTTSAIMANWYGSTLNQYLLRMSGGLGIQWYTRVGSSVVLLNTNYLPNVGEWIHVVGVKDAVTNGGQMRVYINGAESTNSPLNNTVLSGALSANNTADTIGVFSNNVSFINGSMSNVAYWTSTALTQPEVTTLYNNGSPIQTLSNIPQNSNLQAWYKLDASATYDGSNWTIPDDSSNSNDGTSSGMTQANLVQSDLSFKTSYSPYALDFDGTNHLGGSGYSIFNLQTISYSIWFKRTGSLTGTSVLMTRGQSSNIGWTLWLSNAILIAQFADGGNESYDNSRIADYKTAIPDNTWGNVIATFDGTNQKIYVNGQLLNTYSKNAAIDYGQSSIFYIGQRANGSANFVGEISNPSIWNTALTSAQVTEIYSEGIPQNLLNHSAASSLVSWWQLGSNSSFNTNWTVLDEKGSNNVTSVNMGEDAIVDGVGSYANGLSSGMGGDEIIGDAPYSTANSLSVNMDVLDRVEDTPA